MRVGRWRLSRVSQAMTVAVAALAAAMVIAAACVGLGLHREAEERAGHETQRLAVVLAEQTAQAVDSVNMVLSDLAHDDGLALFRTSEELRSLMGSADVHRDLRTRLAGLPQANRIAIVGADGRQVNSSWNWPAAAADVSDRDDFRAARDAGTDGPFIGEPVLSQEAGVWVVDVARRITAPDGGFLGMIVASIHLTYFSDFYAAIGLPDGMRVNVVRRDGMVLTSFPEDEGRVGHPLVALAEWRAAVAAGGGTYWTPGRMAGSPRLVYAQQVSRLPLVVTVGMTRTAIFAPWWRQIGLLTVATSCVLVCLGLLLRMLLQQFRRLEATEADLTGRNRELDAARAALDEKSCVLETTLANMDQGLMMVTAEGIVAVCNDRAIELLALPRALALRRPRFREILDHQWESGEFSGDPAMKVLLDRGGFIDRPQSYERRRPNGMVLEVRTVPLAGGGLVRTYTDITQRRIAEEQVRFAARHDALTGLPNRAAFAEWLDAAVARADLADQLHGVAVLYIDLDRFKQINDTLGHRAGDELLQHVARRMSGALRESDILARMGGDEFALLMPGLGGPEAATSVAHRLLDVVRRPYDLEEGQARIGVSIGIACAPEHGRTGDELLNNADLALYRAKNTGRDCTASMTRAPMASSRTSGFRGRTELRAAGPAAFARLPADLGHPQPAYRRHRGAGALAPPGEGLHLARQLHSACRAHRPHHSARPLGAGMRLPRGADLGESGAGFGERLAEPAAIAGPCRRGPRGARGHRVARRAPQAGGHREPAAGGGRRRHRHHDGAAGAGRRAGAR